MAGRQRYSNETRQQLLADYVAGGFSYRELSEKYNVSDPSVKKWIADFNHNKAHSSQEIGESPAPQFTKASKTQEIVDKLLALPDEVLTKLRNKEISVEEVLSDKEDKEALHNLGALCTKMTALCFTYGLFEKFDRSRHTGTRIGKSLKKIDELWNSIQVKHQMAFKEKN